MYQSRAGAAAVIDISASRPPPLAQSHFDRWSLVYFTRPGDSVHLKALVGESTIIAKAVAETPDRDFDSGATASQWFARRQAKWRVDNQKVMLFVNPSLCASSSHTRFSEGDPRLSCEQRNRVQQSRSLITGSGRFLSNCAHDMSIYISSQSKTSLLLHSYAALQL